MATKALVFAADVDGVLADYESAIYSCPDRLRVYLHDSADFWLDVKPFPDALKHFKTTPAVYVTSRPVCVQHATEQWLAHHCFPKAPVRAIGPDRDKVPYYRQFGVDLVVEDDQSVWRRLNQSGIRALLLNRGQYGEGLARENMIHSLEELQNYVNGSSPD